MLQSGQNKAPSSKAVGYTLFIFIALMHFVFFIQISATSFIVKTSHPSERRISVSWFDVPGEEAEVSELLEKARDKVIQSDPMVTEPQESEQPISDTITGSETLLCDSFNQSQESDKSDGSLMSRDPAGDVTEHTEITQLDIILQAIDKNKVYPISARKRRLEGDVLISFTILPDGRVRDICTTGNGIHAFLEEAAVLTIKRCQPFPIQGTLRLPKDVSITMRYRLDAS